MRQKTELKMSNHPDSSEDDGGLKGSESEWTDTSFQIKELDLTQAQVMLLEPCI